MLIARAKLSQTQERASEKPGQCVLLQNWGCGKILQLSCLECSIASRWLADASPRNMSTSYYVYVLCRIHGSRGQGLGFGWAVIYHSGSTSIVGHVTQELHAIELGC